MAGPWAKNWKKKDKKKPLRFKGKGKGKGKKKMRFSRPEQDSMNAIGSALTA